MGPGLTAFGLTERGTAHQADHVGTRPAVNPPGILLVILRGQFCAQRAPPSPHMPPVNFGLPPLSGASPHAYDAGVANERSELGVKPSEARRKRGSLRPSEHHALETTT